MMAQVFVVPPFGRFVECDAILERILRVPGFADGRRYVGYFLRTMGRIREALEEDERAYRLDALHPMTANNVALARMAAGRVAEAVPVYEDLVERLPDMSFPVSSLLRCYAFQQDWAAVDRLLELAARRQLREFQEGLPFIRTKRDPTPQNIEAWRSTLEAQVNKTGRVDVSRLVYSAHLGLVEEAYRAVETAHLGPAGTNDDIMGPRRLPHLAAVPGWNARVAKRPALRTPVRAAGARRVLDGDGQVARLCRRSPLRFQSRVREGARHPKRRFRAFSNLTRGR